MSDLSDVRHPLLRVPDVIVIGVIVAVVILATAVAIVESYRNLWLFAENYGLSGWRAAIAPVAVPDSFIVVGEGMLFVGLVRNWTDRSYHVFAWLLAAAGFAISVAGNVGHLHTATWPERAMFALFPIAATAGLAAGLMILKRVTARYRANVSDALMVTGQAAPPGRQREPRRGTAARRAARDPAARLSSSRAAGRPPQPVEITPALQASLDEGVSAREVFRRHPELFTSRWKANDLVKSYSANGGGPAQAEEASGE